MKIIYEINMFNSSPNFLNIIFSPISWVINNVAFIATISIIVSIILIIYIIKYIIKSGYFNESKEFSAKHALDYSRFDKRNTQKIWETVLEMVSASNPIEWKKSVIIADELLTETLRRAGYKGVRMEYILPNISDEKVHGISEFKRLRANIFKNLMDESYAPNLGEIKKILRKYRELLQSFGVIE